jgi:PAS domain-containing protein
LDKRLILRGPQQMDSDEMRRDDPRPAPGAVVPSPTRVPLGASSLPSDRLFSIATEPVIIVEAATRRIVQANPASAELLGDSNLIGRPIFEAFHVSSAESLREGLDFAASAQGMTGMTCRSAAVATELRAVVSWFRADADSYFLIRLADAAGGGSAPSTPISPVFQAVESASVGFLLTDAEFRIEYANQAFIDLVGLADADEVLGRALEQWLQLSAADLARLRNQMGQRQATSTLAVRLVTQGRKAPDVEVCAVAVPDGRTLCWGFTISELPRRN